MLIPCDVPSCANPIADDAYVCAGCTEELRLALLKVGEEDGLAVDLDLTLARQHRTGPGNLGRRSTETPLAYDPRASEAAAVLRNTLSTWCRLLQEEIGGGLPQDDLASMARWLGRFVQWLRRSDIGAECVDEIVSAVAQAERSVDLPTERVLAGVCARCGKPCYARAGADRTRCRECGTELTVSEGRERLLRAAGDRLVTAAEGARSLRVLGHDVSAAAVRGYARRGRITVKQRGSADRPLYSLGDVLDAYLDSSAA
ncbi:LIM domain-containing protein [Nocardiopsis ganjiahuensis]|uniref:hypothetical protein n=1 Tax=Nocardiopsis ganjiahuensis TaxID=239984 RepID=UPI00034A43C0|nr:hypothetical protein [Nocardiopsis ganjiahuensis]